jgi:hypothetical protein
VGLRDSFIATLGLELHVARPRQCNAQLLGSSTQLPAQPVRNGTSLSPRETSATVHATPMQLASCAGVANTRLELHAPAPQVRPYKLSIEQAGRCHAQPWDNASIARFVRRVSQFLRVGFNATDADDLAERLHLRDLEGDDRAMCAECKKHRVGSCSVHVEAGLVGPAVSRDVAVLLQRCLAFERKEQR